MYEQDLRKRACALAAEIGVRPAAARLGLSRSSLQRWVEAGTTLGLMSKAKNSPESQAVADAMADAQREIRRLKKENEDLKKANWVLKEVSSFFSNGRSKSNLKRSFSSPKKGKKT